MPTRRRRAFRSSICGSSVRRPRLDDVDHPFWGEPDAMHDGVIVMPEAGYISDPQLSAQNLASAAVAAGAEFRFKTEVASIDRDGGRVSGITTADGEQITSRVVVNVAGPHARIVNEMAGVLASMKRTSRALRREVYIVPAPPGSDFDRTGFSMGDGDTGVYFRGERGNNILIGNAEPECDELEWVDDPDAIDDVLSDDGFELHALRTARRVKGTPIPLQKSGLVSMYDATPDWTPIYDRSDVDGFYIACGTSGNQFKNAPVAGHLMAELITAVEAGHDHDADPLVVTGKYTGLPIDVGTFTRNRSRPRRHPHERLRLTGRDVAGVCRGQVDAACQPMHRHDVSSIARSCGRGIRGRSRVVRDACIAGRARVVVDRRRRSPRSRQTARPCRPLRNCDCRSTMRCCTATMRRRRGT